ncbi:MAG: c-type cytochrome [Gammaproteobacteria bacterium]|nr:c-type cytochrome [Gammaproteobacteria bacterium]
MLIKNLLKVSAFIITFLATTNTFADQATAMKIGCAGCHQMAVKTVGPAIKDIAKKHNGANIDDLVKLVKSGKNADQLTWGTIPMPPSPAPEADVKKVISWMLQQ